MHVLVYVEGVIYQMDEHNERLSANQDDRQDVELPGECTPTGTGCEVLPLLHFLHCQHAKCCLLAWTSITQSPPVQVKASCSRSWKPRGC
jgi:hypothetical protein